MDNLLPVKPKLIIIFLSLVVFLIVYVFVVRPMLTTPTTNVNTNTQNEENLEVSDAFLIPPDEEFKEVEVTGRVVSVEGEEKPQATHKIVDLEGNIIVYAVTNDDKLVQQEGSIVTMVGEVPSIMQVTPDTVVNIKYILFK